MGKQWKQWLTLFSGLQNHCRWWRLLLGRKVMTNLDSTLKNRDITLPTTVEAMSSQSYGFSSSHVWMWELDCEERWVPKNWCFWTVVLEKTLEGPLDCKEIQPVHPKGDQSWVFIGRTNVEAETPIHWWYSNTLVILQYWSKELTDLKRCWCWERLRAGGEGDDRGWDGRIVSLTQWTWVWINSGSWWWTGRPGVVHGVAKSWTW